MSGASDLETEARTQAVSCLEKQLEELEVVSCVFSDSVSVDDCSREAAEKLVSAVRSGSALSSCLSAKPRAPLKLTADLCADLVAEIELPTLWQPSTQLETRLRPQLFIRCHRSGLYSAESLSQLRHAISSHLSVDCSDSGTLFELIDWLIAATQSTLQKSAASTKHRAVSSSMPVFRLRRSYLWFHHIYSSKKKDIIKTQAKRHAVYGFCVTGKPGVIVAEGHNDDVKAFATHLKGLTWKRMIERHVEEEKCDSIECLHSKLLFGDGFSFLDYKSGVKGGMKKVNELMLAAGLSRQFAYLADVHSDIDLTAISASLDTLSTVDSATAAFGVKSKSDSTDSRRVSSSKGSAKVKQLAKPKWIEAKSDGAVVVKCRVIPNSRRTEVLQWADGSGVLDESMEEVSIRLNAKPKDGEANAELTSFLAKVCSKRKSQVSVIRGHKSRSKSVRVAETTVEAVTAAFVTASV